MLTFLYFSNNISWHIQTLHYWDWRLLVCYSVGLTGQFWWLNVNLRVYFPVQEETGTPEFLRDDYTVWNVPCSNKTLAASPNNTRDFARAAQLVSTPFNYLSAPSRQALEDKGKIMNTSGSEHLIQCRATISIPYLPCRPCQIQRRLCCCNFWMQIHCRTASGSMGRPST